MTQEHLPKAVSAPALYTTTSFRFCGKDDGRPFIMLCTSALVIAKLWLDDVSTSPCSSKVSTASRCFAVRPYKSISSSFVFPLMVTVSFFTVSSLPLKVFQKPVSHII